MSVDTLPVTTSRVGRRSKDPTGVIRIKADLADMFSQVCTRRKVSMADALDPVIRPFIEAEYDKMADEIADERRNRLNGHGTKPKRKKDE